MVLQRHITGLFNTRFGVYYYWVILKSIKCLFPVRGVFYLQEGE